MLKKIYVSFSLLLFAFSLFLGVDRFAHRSSSHFSLDKVVSQYPNAPEWDLPPLSVEEEELVNKILDQKFTYYSKGSQVYVFISEDKKYILKLLKQRKLRSNSWLSLFRFSFNPYYKERLVKERKWRETLDACKTAFLHLKDETGLIQVHLNRSPCHKKIVVFDRTGKSHEVPIDRTTFCLQKRAQLIYARIAELVYQKDFEGAKGIISSVFSLIEFLGKKGIVDNDPILRKNFGLINDRAIQIDVGKMRIDSEREGTDVYKGEVSSITHSFGVWLEKNYPDLVETFQEELQRSTQ